jgi:diguanylate cyclase (GGDEF)-like protein/PAS domain S-box-containing protein
MLEKTRRFLSPPVFEDAEMNFIAHNLNIILLSSIVGIFITLVRFVALGKFQQDNLGTIFAVAGLIGAFSYVLLKYKQVKLASYLFVSTFSVLPLLLMINGNGIHDTIIMLLPIVVIVASMLFTGREMLVYTIILALGFGSIVRAEVTGRLVTEFSAQTTNSDATDALLILSVGALLSSLLATTLRRNLHRLGKALKEREASEEKYRLISDLSTDYVFSSTVDKNRVISHNWESGAFESISGYTPEEFRIKGGWRTTLHPDDLMIDDQMLEKIFSNQKAVGELRVIAKNGEIRWVRIYARPVWSEQENRLIGIYGAVQDVDEQKRIGGVLHQRDAILEAVAHAAQVFLQSANWRESINNVLQELGKVTDASHVYVFENHTLPDGERVMSQRYEWTAPGQTPDIDDPQYQNISLTKSEVADWIDILGNGEPYARNIQSLPENDVLLFQKRGLKSILDVPIFVAGEWWGEIGFDDHINDRAWSPVEIETLEVAAKMIGAAIENERISESIRAREKRSESRRQLFAKVIQLGKQVTEAGDLLTTLRNIRNGVRSDLDFDRAAIFLYKPDDNTMQGSFGTDRSGNLTEEWGIEFKIDGNTFFRNVLGQPDGLYFTQDYETERGLLLRPGHVMQGVKYYAAVACWSGNKPVAIICVDQLITGRVITNEQLEALRLFTGYIGLAIQNALFSADLENRIQQRTQELSDTNTQLQSEKLKIEQVADEVAILRRLSDFLQASVTVEEASNIITQHMNALFPNTSGALFLIADGFVDLSPMATWGSFEASDVIQPSACWGMRRGRAFTRHYADTAPACAHFGDTVPPESMCLPLLAQGDTIGMICLQVAQEEKETYFTTEVQSMAIASADSIALALANLRLRERLHNQSVRDPLTGLFNRRYMEETLARETHRASRNQCPLCVVMFEIDDFKVYNNTYGHEAGDYVLRKVADTMRANLRHSDFPCRYGGDEFTLILPDTNLDAGAHRADELRKAVEALTLSFNNQALGQVTVRMGVAVYPKHGETGDAVLKVADDASYRARAIGKNCVVVAE